MVLLWKPRKPFPLRKGQPTCRVGVWLECARHHLSKTGGWIPTRLTAMTITANGKRSVNVKSSKQAGLYFSHSCNWGEMRQLSSPRWLKHISPSDGKFCGGRNPGAPLRRWTTRHSLAFTHLTSTLSASSTAMLNLSLKWLSPQHIPKPSNCLYPTGYMCLRYSIYRCLFFHLLDLHILVLLTRGSVPSSVPAGVGCFPASEGSGWSQCHSLLSPGGRSTSHCWTSVDCKVKMKRAKDDSL